MFELKFLLTGAEAADFCEAENLRPWVFANSATEQGFVEVDDAREVLREDPDLVRVVPPARLDPTKRVMKIRVGNDEDSIESWWDIRGIGNARLADIVEEGSSRSLWARLELERRIELINRIKS
tara:strand:- start:5709 stop:6080 length:372 start_codon:yes stop_codon:yes gene_type:complete